jgi:two-component sensor histidine kinase
LFRGRSISLKQGLLLVVLAALLPISATSVIQSMANWNGMQRAALEGLKANAKAISERERDAFLVSSRLLMVAAANPEIRNITTKCSEILRTGFAGYNPIVNFLRTDEAGQVRCSILPFREGTSVSGQLWWERTKRSGNITVSQPTIGTVSGIPIIVMALPMKNSEGQFGGTLSAGLDISRLATSVANAPEAKAGSISVISKNDELVASSGQAIPFDLPTDLRNGMSGTAKSPSGEKWLYSVVSLVDDELLVLYAEPRSRIMSAALSQFRASIILPLAAIILTLLAIWFGTNRLVIRWLASLRKLSDDMTKGNFADNRGVFAEAPLELRELSDDLHEMAEAIDSRTTQLTEALQAKTELTREVHHRVKNNLQIVTSLLTMQASRMADNGAQTALKQARARIVALALIHRLTYEQDTESAQPTVAVETLLEELCKQLRYAHRDRRSVDLTCRTDDYAVPVDHAVPLALFMVEAITNSYRHAFADGDKGTIEASFELTGDEASLKIIDSGRGYDVGGTTETDLGTELMHGFASQLNGSVHFSSGFGTGSITTLRFPA